MKHNWLCKNLSDIGKIQQIHVHLLFFLLSQILIIQIHTQKIKTTHSQHSIQGLHNDMDLI